MILLNGGSIVSVGERSNISVIGEYCITYCPLHGNVWVYFQGARFSIGTDSNFTIQESSAVSFINGEVSIGDKVSIYLSNSSIFTVQRADDQPSLFVLKEAVVTFGQNSWLLVDNGYLYIGTKSKFITGRSSEVYVGPGNLHLGPGSKVEIAKGSSIEVYGRPNEDSLVLHDNAGLQISTDATLLIGNGSVVVILPNKWLSMGERSKLSVGKNIYCLVISDVDVPEYTKAEIDSSQGNPEGFRCVPQLSDDIRQLEAQYVIIP